MEIEGVKAIIVEMTELVRRGVIQQYAIGGSVAVMRYPSRFLRKIWICS